MELVSIISPSFNSEKFIEATIQSVQNQAYQNWEMIILDDCSLDKTVSIVEHIVNNDGRIKVYKLEKNSGTGIARNTGLTKANGKHIAFLDANDLCKLNKLALQIDLMKANNLPFTFSFYDCINESGRPFNRRIETLLHRSYSQLFFVNT